MAHDEDELRKLNVRIGAAETAGDREFLDGVLAPALAFRRASGAVVDRATFLDDVKPSAARDTAVETVTLFGRDRALVTCMVTMDGAKRFHNVRLFVRTAGAAWTLLAWANEPA